MSRTVSLALTLLVSLFAGVLSAAAPELADNPRTPTEYDADGRVTRTTDAYGNLIGFAKYNETTDALEVQDLTDPAFSYASLTSEYLFTGEQWDADLGMYFLRARYLNTATGRFHSMDSYEGRNGEPLTLHKYSYAHGNPVANIDPTGHYSLTEQASTIGTITALSGLGLTGVNSALISWGAPDWLTIRIEGFNRMLFASSAMFYATAIAPAAPYASVALFAWAADEMYSGWLQLITGVRQRTYLAQGLHLSGVPYPDMVADAAPGIVALPKMMISGYRMATTSLQSFFSRAPKSVVGTGAESVNAGTALRSKLSALENAQQGAARTRTLPDGRVRYYGPETPATNPGATRGASYVTEHNPQTGQVRSWMESYDQAGSVNRVHPKMINGQQVQSQHYPPTARELGQ